MSQTEYVTIAATRRTQTGKGYSRKLRVAGKIPANLVENAKSTPLELDPKWLSKAWKSGKIFNLEFEGTTRLVEIKELQINAIKRYAVHVDLMYK